MYSHEAVSKKQAQCCDNRYIEASVFLWMEYIYGMARLHAIPVPTSFSGQRWANQHAFHSHTPHRLELKLVLGSPIIIPQVRITAGWRPTPRRSEPPPARPRPTRARSELRLDGGAVVISEGILIVGEAYDRTPRQNACRRGFKTFGSHSKPDRHGAVRLYPDDRGTPKARPPV